MQRLVVSGEVRPIYGSLGVKRLRRLENDNWTIHFTCVKAHNDNYGKELADHLAKEAASRSEAETAHNKTPKSAVIRGLKEEGEWEWQSEWTPRPRAK